MKWIQSTAKEYIAKSENFLLKLIVELVIRLNLPFLSYAQCSKISFNVTRRRRDPPLLSDMRSNLKNLSSGLNLRRGSNMVSST